LAGLKDKVTAGMNPAARATLVMTYALAAFLRLFAAGAHRLSRPLAW